MIQIELKNKIPVYMTEDEARLFVEFQKHHAFIGYLIGYMDTLQLADPRNLTIVMDIGDDGAVHHTAITRHYRK